MRRLVFAVGILAAVGCASSPPPEPVAPPEPKVAEDLPTYCTGGDNPCRPTRDFAKRLCQGSFPGAALYLFQKSSPWQHRWVKTRGLEGKNGEGGPSGGELQFAEEVVVMAYDEATADGVDKKKGKKPDASLVVVRWDGTCATVTSADVVTYQPGAQKHTPVDYTKFDSSVQRSLLRDADIDKAVTARQKACEGGASADCEKAHQALSTLIVNKIRHGTRLSMPDERP